MKFSSKRVLQDCLNISYLERKIFFTVSNVVHAVVLRTVYKIGDLEKQATLETLTTTRNASFYIKSHLEFQGGHQQDTTS